MKNSSIRIAEIEENTFILLPSGFKKRTIDGDKILRIINIKYFNLTERNSTVKGFCSQTESTYITKFGDIRVINTHDGSFAYYEDIEQYLKNKIKMKKGF